MSVLQDIASGITSIVAPDLQNVEAQAAQASQQLQMAFEVIIAEGAIIAALMLIQVWLLVRTKKS